MESGAEISCGGERWRDNALVEPQVEDKSIHDSVDVLQAITGDKTLPHGACPLHVVSVRP